MISLLCPTRGRPDNIHRMVKSVFDTDTRQTSEIVFYVDNDDVATVAKVVELNCEYPNRIQMVVGERNRNISKMYNICADTAKGNILGQSGDDVLYHTMGWTELIENVFNQYGDKIVMAYGRDGIHDQNHGTHPFIHRNWVRALGYFANEKFIGDFSDTWTNDLAKLIDRRIYIPELFTEHIHPAVGKAPWDSTYAERFALQSQTEPERIYLETACERIEDAQKLQQVIDSFKE